MTTSRRTLLPSVLEARTQLAVAAPLRRQVGGWVESTTRLAARADHAILHGRPIAEIDHDIGLLLHEIVGALETWRASLDAEPLTGYVADAEKSVRSTLTMLDALRMRTRTHGLAPAQPRRSHLLARRPGADRTTHVRL